MIQHPQTMEWIGDAVTGGLRLIDQTRLPQDLVYRDCRMASEVVQAIRTMAVRGAPALGIAAAYGCVLGARTSEFPQAAESLAASRPTAVNLFWALNRMKRLGSHDPARLLQEARAIHAEDAAMCEAIGRTGLPLIQPGAVVLTHCNAGALATGGMGTATAPMYLAREAKIPFTVIATETRPQLQGARLTAWELGRAGIDVTVICDTMTGAVMRQRRVSAVFVGADRIAANGDTANKIGTYPLAILARHHGIPFYVAAPATTFDRSIPSGDGIPIEERGPEEVTHVLGRRTVPEGVAVFNPAFDVTPHELITGIVTDRGLIRPVTPESLRALIFR